MISPTRPTPAALSSVNRAPSYPSRDTAAIASSERIWSMRAACKKIRRLLAKYDHPPDFERKAVEQVLKQAEVFATGVTDEGTR